MSGCGCVRERHCMLKSEREGERDSVYNRFIERQREVTERQCSPESGVTDRQTDGHAASAVRTSS